MSLAVALKQARRRKDEIQAENLLRALADARSSQRKEHMAQTNKAVSDMQEQVQQLVSQMQSDAPDAPQHGPAQKPRTSPAEENTSGRNKPANSEIGEGANES